MTQKDNLLLGFPLSLNKVTLKPLFSPGRIGRRILRSGRTKNLGKLSSFFVFSTNISFAYKPLFIYSKVNNNFQFSIVVSDGCSSDNWIRDPAIG